MTQALNFQSIIMTLQDFWARQGCLIWQPYYTQVGAGTMNPATALRVLGPEPWRVGYVEPSIRPDDGRYGENPNRMQMHYQFQVILKPDPGNPQELYLKSLEALGIDPRQHDIRFVEDNWESPALGAWGLGWEVWLDGQEITQFTYFQQAGGVPLDPVSVELTYGLERIAIALQQVDSFRDIQWSPQLKDGDVNLQAEQEHSKYYFEVADVERLWKMYELFEAEAEACLSQGLVLPAHDYILKCSHTFNVLDTRGAVGVTERQGLFGRMRELSRRTALAFLEQRQHLEYPFIEDETAGEEVGRQTGALLTSLPVLLSPAPLLVEIGTEELPVGDFQAALSQLEELLPALLVELRLAHGPVKVLGTPRRLVIYVEELSPRQADLEQIIKGPPAERAFTSDGALTPAGEGFARSRGIPVEDLKVVEISGGRYASAVVRQAGRPASQVLSEALPGLIASLRFDKPMRWNSPSLAFSRPIRWLLAIYGEGKDSHVVPFEYAGLCSSNRTRGLRFHQPEEYSVHGPAEFFASLVNQGIILDPDERRVSILSMAQTIAKSVGGKINDDPALLAEVTNLVEAPIALLGSFDTQHLRLPPELLTSVMKKHQRYFPVKSATEGDETLLPYFIAIRNGDDLGMERVREGNEHVIRARFTDAVYFVREDLKKPLEGYLPQLDRLTFQARLGSMLDKSHRIVALVEALSGQMNMDEGQLNIARRAAELCKADLATQMVVDMTSLQGFMGRFYALQSGESQAVAQAIYEHYLPRSTGDKLPESQAGLAVGLADRLDSLVGLFAASLAPTGNKDPFAQRRAALGLVQTLVGWKLDFDLRPAITTTAQLIPLEAGADIQTAVLAFITERLRNMLLDQGKRYDVVDAILAVQGHNPARAASAVAELMTWTARPDWHTILPAYARCVRITRSYLERFPVDQSVFSEAEELELFAALQKAQAVQRQPGSVEDFLNSFLPIIPTINCFFDKVLVMVEDQVIQRNRLGLLQELAALAEGVVDLSKLEGF